MTSRGTDNLRLAKKNDSLLTDRTEPGVPLVERKLSQRLRLQHVTGNGLRPSNWLMSAVWKHRWWMTDAVGRRRKCGWRAFDDGDVRCQWRQWPCDRGRRHARSTLVVAAAWVVENTRQYVRSSFGRQRLRVLQQSQSHAVNSRSRSLYVIVRPSVCLSVCLSVVCNVCAPYLGDWNFRQCFYAIWYLGHPLTSR